MVLLRMAVIGCGFGFGGGGFFVGFVFFLIRTAFSASYRNASYRRTAVTPGQEDFGNTERLLVFTCKLVVVELQECLPCN